MANTIIKVTNKETKETKEYVVLSELCKENKEFKYYTLRYKKFPYNYKGHYFRKFRRKGNEYKELINNKH